MVERSLTETSDKVCSACKHRTKERSEKERRNMLNRLNRIEGQIATALDEYYASVLNMESMMDVPVFDSLPDVSDDIETGEND